jgi:hypothetical protein
MVASGKGIREKGKGEVILPPLAKPLVYPASWIVALVTGTKGVVEDVLSC